MNNITNSPIHNISFNGFNFLIKRDDLLHPNFSGNKARKFYYFFKNYFTNINTIVSHGSNQSNAMYSLSSLAKLKGWNYIYYTSHIPSFLEENPQGNYKYALENGMELRVGEYNFTTIKDKNPQYLYIDEGGAIDEARYGLEILANEIQEYASINGIHNLKIFLPSGTGTTALFLQIFLKDIEVLTCPCVGDSEYLTKQFLELEQDTTLHPSIIKTKKKYHFGKLYKENYEVYKQLLDDTKIEFDLLYDPIGISTLMNNYPKNSTILYIHQGGIIGNETMLQRYKYKYDKIQ